MIQKKLEKDSKYSYLDVDGDGIVDDDEMRLHDMEMQDRKENAQLRKLTAQRRMATAVLCFMALYTLLMFAPFIPDTRIKLLTDLSNLLYITGGGIVGAYMGVSAWMNKK
jgi:hypothetical protein